MKQNLMPRVRRSDRNSSPRRPGNILVGCLVVLGIVVVLLVAGGVFVMMNWRGWTADLAQAGAEAGIRKLDEQDALPTGEGDQMIAQIERFTSAFKDGDVSVEQFGTFMQGLASSKFFEVAYAYAVELSYVPTSGLTDEAKAEGQVVMQRLARGYYDGQIDTDTFKAALSAVMGTDSQGNPTLKQRDAVSDADIRATIDAAKKAADDAGVAEDPPRVDLSDALKARVDEALGVVPAEVEEPAAPETPEPPQAEDETSGP